MRDSCLIGGVLFHEVPFQLSSIHLSLVMGCAGSWLVGSNSRWSFWWVACKNSSRALSGPHTCMGVAVAKALKITQRTPVAAMFGGFLKRVWLLAILSGEVQWP